MDSTQQVEQRLSMSLDDLIKNNKKNDGAKQRGGRPAKQAGTRRSRLGGKAAKENEAPLRQTDKAMKTKGRGPKAKGALGVRVKGLKSAPKQMGGRASKGVKQVVKAAGAAVKQVVAKVRAGRPAKGDAARSGRANGRGANPVPANSSARGGGRGGGRSGSGRGRGRGQNNDRAQAPAALGVPPTAMKVTFQNRQHSGGDAHRGGGSGRRSSGRGNIAERSKSNRHGVVIPSGW